MVLIDTHCHIHSPKYGFGTEVIAEAVESGVTGFICVGTDLEDSRLAVQFASARDNCWASVGIHPHEASKFTGNLQAKKEFEQLASHSKVVAIGECGLDFFYDHSPRGDQYDVFDFQLNVANEYNLPLIFHVRNAYPEFVNMLTVNDYDRTRGVVHSFTGNLNDYQMISKGLAHLTEPLYFGLNGITTFTKVQAQLDMAKVLPLQKLLIETDAPYLTPAPFRGTMCEPKHIVHTAEFLAGLRGESLEELASATVGNAQNLFGLY